MRRGEIFWGGLLVILGGLFFLKTAGYLTGDVFGWFWPVAVVAAGIWILLGGLGAGSQVPPDNTFAVPLQGATEASLSINHGMGRVEIRAGTAADLFLTGTAAVSMHHTEQLIGTRLQVSVDAGPSGMPFIGPEGGVWQYRLNPAVPTRLTVKAGASRIDLDLADLRITQFSFEGGASSLRLKVPARVENSLMEIQAGAASVQLLVPKGVAVRFRCKSVGSLDVDEAAFLLRGPGLYESADFDTARFHADITVDGGATSIRLAQEAS